MYIGNHVVVGDRILIQNSLIKKGSVRDDLIDDSGKFKDECGFK